MSPQGTALIAIGCIILLLIVGLHGATRLEGREMWYDEGWRDCEKAHNNYWMTPDDEEVLKHQKLAFKAYIRAKGYRRRGDIKKIDTAENFEDLRHLVWNICVSRRTDEKN